MRQQKKIIKKTNQGFTLIEVLVSVLVLSIGIFGLIALESVALRNNQDAYLRSQVTVLIYDVADKMRSNMGVDYSTISASNSTSCVSYSGAISTCTATQIAQRDLFDWQTTITSILPSGTGSISVSGGVTSVAISWDDDRNPATSAASLSMSFEL
ncbi:type IV pilus modification protein PilV [Motiliproteus sp. MSK22-1]|uniref:type IV pilus modification protein PilV n=1 Tax=Motiliproteus sp. MSK22-1 TaxID=1897630 RepID=UPI000975A155|nr:type IV pilus modification protein PilV [Motiliproteus sp. MSK22-1]OMH28402.1 type IV pilus modification protein PilV [Motiliproteus sp. MSK22-1]